MIRTPDKNLVGGIFLSRFNKLCQKIVLFVDNLLIIW